MWNLPGPGIEPMFPALVGRLLTPGPPGKYPFHPFDVFTYLCFLDTKLSPYLSYCFPPTSYGCSQVGVSPDQTDGVNLNYSLARGQAPVYKLQGKTFPFRPEPRSQ